MAGWNVREPINGQLLSGSGVASGVPSPALDCRNTRNYAYLDARVPAASALISLQASPDGVGSWMTVSQVTAVAGGVTAQIAGYYPWVRAVANAIWSGGGNTGYPIINYTPGMT